MADGSLIFDTKIDGSGFTKGLDGLKGLASSGLKALTGAVTAASGVVTVLGAYATKAGSDFEASMSQVAATMGMTTEEINNGSEAFKLLQATAKEAGATTQFSASESAEALNYLALAGYDAEKACEALPTVLDLAAAGGMDLAYASDLITDSMSALGLATSEMDDFADKLAKTAQKSNTSVSQLGEAILTVGGTAKGLKGGTTELNTALGILADNGVKGAEGGTALRNVILSLSAPTDKAADRLKELGISVLDSQGNMRGLNEIFKDLDASLSGLGDGQKNQILNEIFNKNDLKSVQALLSNTGTRFNELSGQINNANGAAANMAKTMNDNLKGRVKEMKSALEGFGIEVYEGMQLPLKEAAESATESLRNMTEAFKQNGFEGLAESLGAEISKWVSKIAEYLPKVVELGVKVINSLIEGIEDNLDSIVESAETLVMSLIRGIDEMVPRLLELGIKIIKSIGQSIKNNISEVVGIAKNIITSLVDALVAVMPTLLDVGLEVVLEIGKGIADALPNLIYSATELIKQFVDFVTNSDNLEKLIKTALDIVKALAQGIIDNLPELVEAAAKLIGKLTGELLANIPEIVNAAGEIFEAFKDAILAIDWVAVGAQIITDIGNGIKGMGEAFQSDIDNRLKAKIAEQNGTGPKEHNGTGRSLDTLDKGLDNGMKMPKQNLDLTEYDKNANEYQNRIQAIMDAGKKAYEEKVKETEEVVEEGANSVGKTLIDASYKYAKLEQEQEVKRSEEYLSLKEKLDEYEQEQVKNNISEREKVGVAGIQKSYNKYIATEKAKITEKAKSSSDLESKLSKQNAALKIASDTKDLQGAYKVLKTIELDLIEDLDDETRAKKLEDIKNTNQKITEEQLNALAEANQEKLELTKKGIDEEVALHEQYVKTYENTYSGMISAYESAYQTIMNKQTSLEEKFKAFGDLFDKFTQDDVEYMKLGDLQDDINQLTLFGKGLEALKQKGASQDFLETITSMNMEDALDFTELLLTQTDDGFANYLALWEEKQKLAGELASGFYKDEFDTLKTEFTDKVNDELGLMPEEAEKIGQDTASKLAEGLRSGVDLVKGAVTELVAQMQAVVMGEVASVGADLSTSSTVTQNIATKDNGVIGALSAIYGALTEGGNTPIVVEMDGKKVGEGSVDGTIRELQRRGVTLDVD